MTRKASGTLLVVLLALMAATGTATADTLGGPLRAATDALEERIAAEGGLSRTADEPFPALRLVSQPAALLRGQTHAIDAIVTNAGPQDLGSPTETAPAGFDGAIRLEDLLPPGIAASWRTDSPGWTCDPTTPACTTTAPVLAPDASTPPLRLTFTVADDASLDPDGARWTIHSRGWHPHDGRAELVGAPTPTHAAVEALPAAASGRPASADPYLSANWTTPPRAGGHGPLRVDLRNDGRAALARGATIRIALPRGARARAAHGRGWRCTTGPAPRCRLDRAIPRGKKASAVTLDVALARSTAGHTLRARVVATGRSHERPGDRTGRSVRDTAAATTPVGAPLRVGARPSQRTVFEDLTVIDVHGRRSAEHATVVGLEGTVRPADATDVRVRWTQLCTTRRAVRADRGCGGRVAPPVRWRTSPTLTHASFAAPQVSRTTRLRFRLAARSGGARATAVAAVRIVDQNDAVLDPAAVGKLDYRLGKAPKVTRGARIHTVKRKKASRPRGAATPRASAARATRSTPGRPRTGPATRAAQRTAGRAARATLLRRAPGVRLPHASAAATPYVSDAWCALYQRASGEADDDPKQVNLAIGLFRFSGKVALTGPGGCRADGAGLRLTGDLVARGEDGPLLTLADVNVTADRAAVRVGVDDDTKIRLPVGDGTIDLDVPATLKRALEIPFPTSDADEDNPLTPSGTVSAQGFPIPLPGGWSGSVALGFDTHERDEGVDDVALTVSATAVPASGEGRVTAFGSIGIGLNSTRELTDEQWAELMEGMPSPGSWSLDVRGTDVVSLGNGCDVDVEGSVSRQGDEPLVASVSGALTKPCRVSSAVTVDAARVAWGTKTGLSVSGELTAKLPRLADPIHGSLSGTYESAGAWSLAAELDPVTWSPAPGVDVRSGLQGTLRRASGKTLYALTTAFDVTGIPGVTVTGGRIAVTNDCRAAVFETCRDGELNVAAQATATLPAGDGLGLPRSIAIGGALNVKTGDFTLDARLKGWRYGSLTVEDAVVSLGTVDGKRRLSIDATADVGTFVRGARLQADLGSGLFLFSAKHAEAGGFHVDDLTLAYSTTAHEFTPLGRDEPVKLAAKTFTAFGSVVPSGGLKSALSSLQIEGSLELTGEVGFDDGFHLKGGLQVRAGAYLLGGADPAQLSLRWRRLSMAIDVSVGGDSGARVALSAGGAFTMHVPARGGEGAGQDLQLSVTGDIGVSATAGFEASIAARLDSPWVDAFGWEGFTVKRFGLSVGVSNGAPTFGSDGQFAFGAKLAEGLGASGGMTTAFSLQLSPTKPCLQGSVGTEDGGTALNPGRKDVLLVRSASLIVAPRGCGSEPARIGFGFDGAVMGTPVRVDVDVTPRPFSLRGSATIGAFSLGNGRMTFKKTELSLLIDPSASRYEFDLAGGIDVLGASVAVDAHLRADAGRISLDFDGRVDRLSLGPAQIPSARVQLSALYTKERGLERLNVSLAAEAELLGARLSGFTGTTAKPTPSGPATFALDYAGGAVNKLSGRMMLSGRWGGDFVQLRALGDLDYQPGRTLRVEAAGALDLGSSSVSARVAYDSGARTLAVDATLKLVGSDCFRVALAAHLCAAADFSLKGSLAITPSSWRMTGDLAVDVSGRYVVSVFGAELVDAGATIVKGRAGFEAANRPPIRAYVDAELLGIFPFSLDAKIS